MNEQEQAQLQINSNTFQDAVNKPHKPKGSNGLCSGFYTSTGTNWWLSADIRPEAIFLTVNTLNADELRKLVTWMRENLEGASTT